VRDVAEVLHLTSAAVFRLDGALLRRVAASGWDDDMAATIPADGQSTPAVALPLMRRHELLGIEFYGGHESGGDVEPEEVAAALRP